MATDDPNLLELRRRVHADPASFVFAELAEECRRAGLNDEAVAVCRAGLVHHPTNLSARVTLGRALIEITQLDEAFAELTCVLEAEPGNLPAIRAVAEIYQRRGMMSDALLHYRRALQLAQYDTELSNSVDRMEHAAAPPAAPSEPVTTAASVEKLFDFDSLLAQLDSTRTGESSAPPVPPHAPIPSALDAAILPVHDAFADMERQLREREERRLVEEKRARQAEVERRRVLVVQELEGWLSAIVRDRHHAGRSHPNS